jgi:hypothetical protein
MVTPTFVDYVELLLTLLTGCEFCKSSSLLEVAEESCFMLGQCSKHARAKKPCDHRHFMPGCAPETSAFFWPHDPRMLLLPSSVATTRSSCAAENSQPVMCHVATALRGGVAAAP